MYMYIYIYTTVMKRTAFSSHRLGLISLRRLEQGTQNRYVCV